MRRTTSAVLVATALMEDPDSRHWGYDLVRKTQIASGTLYPILKRMGDAGWIESHAEPDIEAEPDRPARNYITVTEPGRAELAGLIASWRRRHPTQELRSCAVGVMPDKFKVLGTYNSEVARGIVHTDEWKAHMAVLQDEFNEWKRVSFKVFA